VMTSMTRARAADPVHHRWRDWRRARHARHHR
jgi:hypothetical protein